MTVLALLLAAGLPLTDISPRVVEAPEPGAKMVVVQAFVPAADRETVTDRATWAVLVEALKDGTSDFTEARLRAFGEQAGYPVEIAPGEGFVRLQVVQPAGGLDVARTLVVSLLQDARLSDEAVREAKGRLARPPSDPWAWVLSGPRPGVASVTAAEVRAAYGRSFRPEAVVVAIGGAIAPGEGVAAFKESLRAVPRVLPRKPRPRREAEEDWGSGVGVVELSGAGPVVGPAQWLAACALGAGKQGALHRVAREQLRLSYRQEAVLWPANSGVGGGFRLRLLVARAAPDSLLAVPDTLRRALLADVETWGEPELGRAKAVAVATLGRGYDLSPLALDSTRFARGGPIDRTAIAGLFALSQPGSDPAGLVEAMASVTLDQMKAAARESLRTAVPIVRPPRAR